MPTLTIDVALFSVFLALNLIVGLLAGRRVKTLHDYSIGGKDFSTATITSTIVATWLSGGFLFYALDNIYTTGLQFIIVTMGLAICLLLTGQVLAVRMGEFLNNLSVAEAMGDLYGQLVRIITAVSGILGRLGYLAIQFQVIGKMLTLILGFKGPKVTIVAAAIVIGYSAFGGIRSVTITDVFQFITFTIFIPILALIVWNHLKNHDQVVHTLATNPVFSFREIVGWHPQFISALGLMLYFSIPALTPSIFQRVIIARDLKQVKSSFTYAAVVTLVMIISVVWVAILLLADNPHLEPSNLIHYIIDHYSYPGLQGLIAVGITAMAMSTADSDLNSFAVLAVHDIIKPLNPSFKESIPIVRLFSLVVGILALLLAVHTSNLLELMLLSGSFYMPIVTVPLLLAIFGFRSSTRAVLIGMAAGLITVIVWRVYFAYTGINSVIPGMVASLFFLMGSHYLLQEKGGWVGIKEKAPLLAARQARRDAWEELIKAIQRPKLYAYLKRNLPQKEYLYFLFGLYIIGATYASFYTIPEEVVAAYQKLYDHIAHSVLIAAAAFLTYPAWPPTFRGKRFIAFAWPLGIGYILFLVGSVLVAMSGFHQVQVMIFMLNLVMAALLLDWPLMLTLSICGVLLALGAFHLYEGPVPLAGVADALQFRVLYGIPLLISFIIALSRFREAKAKLEDQNVSLLTTNQETTSELLASCKDRARFIKAFRESEAPALARLAGLSREIVEEIKGLKLSQSVIQKSNQLHGQLSSIALHLDRLDHRAAGYMLLETATITIDAFLQAVQEKLRGKELSKRIIWKKMTQHKEVECDIARMETLLVNSVSFMRTVGGEDTPILIGLEDTHLGYPMSSVKPNYTKQVAALRITLTTAKMLPALEELYLAQMSEDISPMPEATTDLPLVANERILKAHYGYTSTMANGKTLTQVYVIPVKLREVRPKGMDLPEMELGAKLTRSDDTYPGAQEQEAAFLRAVQERTQADLKLIREAIELIKEYHGPVRRNSGEPFYLHPLAVAHIVLDYNQEEATVLGALLHDTVEDTSLTPDQIAIRFNEEVRKIVNGVTHLDSKKDTFYKVKLSSHENIRQLLEVDDKRVLYVKLADRLHNMRTIQYKPCKSQRQTSEETLLFFVPLADHLGLKEAAEELKELCFEVFRCSGIQ